MNRTAKNLLSFALLALLIATLCLTSRYAVNELTDRAHAAASQQAQIQSSEGNDTNGQNNSGQNAQASGGQSNNEQNAQASGGQSSNEQNAQAPGGQSGNEQNAQASPQQDNNGQSAQAPPAMNSASEPPAAPDNGSEPPAMPGDSNTSKNGGDRNNSEQNAQTPPEQNNNGQNTQAPSGQNDNDQNTQVSGGQSDKGQNAQTPPEQNNNGQSTQAPPAMNGENEPPAAPSGIPYLYCALLAAISALIAVALIYLLMSRLNKRKLRDTFKNRDKITIYILAVLLLSGVIFNGTKALTEQVISSMADSAVSSGMNASSDHITYSAVKEITTDTDMSSGQFSSTEKDQNVISASGDITAKLSNIGITKSGDSSNAESSSFYGNNSGILAKSGSALTLRDMTIDTDASGANGIFCFGGASSMSNGSSDGSTISIKDSTITTTGDSSGGIMAAGGGNINAENLTVNTAGTSSAAVRSDRGGGNIKVSKGSYTTTGVGSPAVYSTADITLSDAELTSKSSEGIVIEGKNSVTLSNCKLTDNNTKLNGLSTTYKNIFLYQSMSGDADTGVASFTAKNSTISTQKGDSFYITNTSAEIILNNNKISNTDPDGNLLRAQKDSWGTDGANGGNVKLSMTKQTATGNIVVDSVSTLDMVLRSGSRYEGTINGENTAKSIAVTLDKNSTLTLTGDSYLTELNDEDTDYGNINFNGHKLYVNGKAIN